MKRLCLLCCLLLGCLGCAADSKEQWDEFWKDVRGENMEMRNDFSGPKLSKPERQP